MTASKPTRHQQLIAAAEDLAADCYWDRTDPTQQQVARTVEAALGRSLDTYDASVAWQAYREKFADFETGSSTPPDASEDNPVERGGTTK